MAIVTAALNRAAIASISIAPIRTMAASTVEPDASDEERLQRSSHGRVGRHYRPSWNGGKGPWAGARNVGRPARLLVPRVSPRHGGGPLLNPVYPPLPGFSPRALAQRQATSSFFIPTPSEAASHRERFGSRQPPCGKLIVSDLGLSEPWEGPFLRVIALVRTPEEVQALTVATNYFPQI